MTTPYAESTRDDPADCRRCGGPLAGDNTTNFCYKCRREMCWETQCNECGGTGTVIVTSSPGLPEHGSIEQESCPKCNGEGTQ